MSNDFHLPNTLIQMKNLRLNNMRRLALRSPGQKARALWFQPQTDCRALVLTNSVNSPSAVSSPRDLDSAHQLTHKEGPGGLSPWHRHMARSLKSEVSSDPSPSTWPSRPPPSGPIHLPLPFPGFPTRVPSWSPPLPDSLVTLFSASSSYPKLVLLSLVHWSLI